MLEDYEEYIKALSQTVGFGAYSPQSHLRVNASTKFGTGDNRTSFIPFQMNNSNNTSHAGGSAATAGGGLVCSLINGAYEGVGSPFPETNLHQHENFATSLGGIISQTATTLANSASVGVQGSSASGGTPKGGSLLPDSQQSGSYIPTSVGQYPSSRDTISIVVNALSLSTSTSSSISPSGVLFVGELTHEQLRATAGAEGLPWGMHLSMLFQAVRCGDWTVMVPSSSAVDFSKPPKHHHPSPTPSPILNIETRSPLPMQWLVTLYEVSNKERRRAIAGLLTQTIMYQHTLTSIALQREQRARSQVEEKLQKAYDSGIVPEHLRSPKKQGQGGQETAVEVKKKPQSLLNPAQKVGQKRARGVKIS